MGVGFDVQRYGYGYSDQGNSTVQFAITILLVHAALALGHLVHLLYLAWRRTTSSAWGNMGEMLVLALVSRSQDGLANVGAGVQKTKSWRRKVRVREKDEESLALIVGDGHPGVSMVRVGRKYR